MIRIPYCDRLDAGESMFYSRQLEQIETEAYAQPLEPTEGRTIVPQIQGLDPLMQVLTWREITLVGLAALISDEADDLPEAEVYGAEVSKTYKQYGSRYGYTVDEIKIAARLGSNLDRDRSRGCWEAVDRKIDNVIATGDSKVGLLGILNQTGTTSFTLTTKADGTQAWGTIESPNATGKQVAQDMMGIVTKAYETSKQLFKTFRLCLPVRDYNYAAQIPYGSASDITALEFVRKNCPFLESIRPWDKCRAAGAGGTSSRMAAFPVDPRVVGLALPVDHERQAPVLKNYKYVINERSKTGGVIAKMPFLIHYGDGLAV